MAYQEYKKEVKRLQQLEEEGKTPFEPFSEQIFMGSGEISELYCIRAHSQLDQALMLVSGLQQPNMSTSPPEEEGERDSLKKELRQVLVSLLTGILGKEFSLRIE